MELEFEKPLRALKNKIQELSNLQDDGNVDLSSAICDLKAKLNVTANELYSSLGAWEITQIARHKDRPRMLDYVDNIFTDFVELHGDRHFADDLSIVGGLAKLDQRSVMIIGQQKGKNTKENIARNFGMPSPEGYRKALRLMQLAQKFNLPVITFVDTPGAYPGIGAEERNQSEAIGRNLYEMSSLTVPIVVNIIGEGGSGGALAIAVGDEVNMLEYAIYSTITPEGCAAILWKDASFANIAAEILGITANKLYELNLIDRIIKEPLGGAHNDYKVMMENMRNGLIESFVTFDKLTITDLIDRRYKRIMQYGKWEETV